MLERFYSAFPAFRFRDYKIYFFGQLVSFIGTWIQQIAEGWLVLELTHSAFWVGVIAALHTLPVLVLSLFAGVLIDRVDKKKLLFVLQILFFIFTFILGVLTVTNVVNIYHIAVLVFLLGIINTIDMPARNAYVYDMVGKQHLSSAVALNSSTFNTARVIGPAIAGLMIFLVGIGGAILINAVSYLAVIISLFFIKAKAEPQDHTSHPLHAAFEGLRMAFSNISVRILLILAAIGAIFGWSFFTMLPVAVAQVFNQGVATFSIFSSIIGFGAISGASVVSILSKKLKSIAFILLGNMLVAAGIYLFTLTTILWLSYILLFLIGFGIIMEYSMISATIQHVSPDSMRGRFLSIYFLMFVGMMPIGAFLTGFFAEHFGVLLVLQICAIVVGFSGLWIFWKRKKIDDSHSYIE